jgi:ParB-like chromosome segregation protein Spo0J
MKIHPFANLFPMCSDEEIQELADDIKLHGLREPIVTDQDDMILDGRNRFLACEIAGVKPVFAPFVGNEDEKLAYVVSANIHRRHLNTSQKSMVCAKLKATEEELAADRKKRKAKSVVENLPPQKKGKARDKAGEALGVSGKSVDMAVKVLTDAVPEIISAVESGELAVSAAAVVADMPHDQQRQIVASGGAAAVKDVAAKQRKKKPTKKTAAKPNKPSEQKQNSTHVNMAAYVDGVIELFRKNDTTKSDQHESSIDEFCQSLFDKMQHESAEHLCQWFMDKLGWKRE